MTLPAEKNTSRRLGENASSKAAYQVISRGKGNRQTAGADGDQTGSNLRFQNYTANDLNQYTSRTVPGYVQSLGTAATNAHVLLWGDTNHYAVDYRHGSYFWGELSYDNSGGPLWLNLTNYAGVPGGTNADIVATTSGHIFLPGATESFSYDLDGNLTQDSHWNYAWDAENRLVAMTNRASAAPAQVLHFDYDATGRRLRKQVWNNGNGSGSPTIDLRFVYDNWNLVGICNSSLAAVDSFLWGLDLSDSAQGAGGVGGLLAFSQISGSTVTNTAFPCYDGNGNVAGLVNAADGTLAAQYEYGPFGEVIRATGPMAKANPFRFSTKYYDDEDDQLYYGYRYYNAGTGRWMGRDLVGEQGLRIMSGWGIHEVEAKATDSSLLFVNNAPCVLYDSFGLWPSKNHWLLYPEPNPLSHENSNSRTIPEGLPDHERARVIVDEATRYVDTQQAVRKSYMHAMKADWESVGTAKARANDYVRRHLTNAESLLCAVCSSDSKAWQLALWEFGQALHTIQDATSPAHWGFQTWWSPYTDPIGALNHLRREGFDPGPNSNLDWESKWMWGFFKCKDSAPPLPQDFFLGIQPDYPNE